MTRWSFVLVAAMAALLGAADRVSANLVTNSDFETGDFTGWTVTNGGNPGFTINVDGLHSHQGAFGANFFDT